MYLRFPLSLRNVEDLLAERGIDICHEPVRFWWNRFGQLFGKPIRSRTERLTFELLRANPDGPLTAIARRKS